MSTLPSLGAPWMIALAVIAGCRTTQAPSPAGSSSPAQPAQPALPPLSPKLAPLVERLEKIDSIDASSVRDGMPGAFFELWLELSKVAGQSDFERLAMHQKPIVRAMGLWGLAQQQNERNTALIVSHLLERDPVRHCPGGCICETMPLGGFARALLVDARHLDGARSPLPLLTEAQLHAVDLEVLAFDEIAPLSFRSGSDLGQAVTKDEIRLELPHLVGLGAFRGLSPLQVVKALGRISREPPAGYPTLGFFVRTLRDSALEPDIRLAAASALTRFEDVEAKRAIEAEQVFLDSVGPEPLAARLAGEIQLRREQTELMKPIRDADYIYQTEPLADRALRAFQADHPMVFGDLEGTGSFGKHDQRVHAARAAALVRIVKRHPEFNQSWNTYSDTIYWIDWMIQRPHALQALAGGDPVSAVRAAIHEVLPARQGR